MGPFCRVTGNLEFLVASAWVLKPAWIASFMRFIICAQWTAQIHPRVLPANLMAAEALTHILFQAVGIKSMYKVCR